MKMFFKNRDAARVYNKTATKNKAQDGGSSCATGKRWFIDLKK